MTKIKLSGAMIVYTGISISTLRNEIILFALYNTIFISCQNNIN